MTLRDTQIEAACGALSLVGIALRIAGDLERGVTTPQDAADQIREMLDTLSLPDGLTGIVWGMVQPFRQFASDIRAADRDGRPIAPPSDTPIGRR